MNKQIRQLSLVMACWAAGSAAATELQRGVLIDRDHAQIVLMRPQGGIAAIDVLSGKPRWVNEHADMPMAMAKPHVLALAEPAKRGLLHYAVIDMESGALSSQKYVAISQPARALVSDRLGEQFQIKADANQLNWSYHHTHVSGALLADDSGPSRDGEAPKQAKENVSAVSLAGSFTFDSADAKLVPVAASKAAVREKPVAVEIGQPLPGAARRFRSAGGEHVLVSQPIEQGFYRWTVQNSKGQALGSLDSRHSYLPFDVVDGVLLFVQPLTMRFDKGDVEVQLPAVNAVQLQDGKLLWTAEIRDTEFRGPFPP